MNIRIRPWITSACLVLALLAPSPEAWAAEFERVGAPTDVEVTGIPRTLFIPEMNAERGRELFASKGCVICHAVNDVGGQHTPIDAATMPAPMNAFEFGAKMWRGAEAMTFLQREQLGYVIELTGDDLADIIAFVHDQEEQKKFSREDIPPEILRLMEREGHDPEHHHGDDMPHAH